MPKTTLNYRPPELDILDQNWGVGVDAWAIGCVLVEM
jgi:hypothetical protein